MTSGSLCLVTHENGVGTSVVVAGTVVGLLTGGLLIGCFPAGFGPCFCSDFLWCPPFLLAGTGAPDVLPGSELRCLDTGASLWLPVWEDCEGEAEGGTAV